MEHDKIEILVLRTQDINKQMVNNMISHSDTIARFK
jgi:hypothetical protein